MNGQRRLIGAAPRRQARPLGTDDNRQIVEHVDCATAVGVRDAAIILRGLASALRRSGIVDRHRGRRRVAARGQ